MAKKEQVQTDDLMSYAQATACLTREEKIGQFFMPAVFINDTEEEIVKIESLIRDHHVGGICFFHSRASAATNYEGEEHTVVYNAESLLVLEQLVERYQRAAKYPLMIAIDAEWGLAMRIENAPQFPYAITLGAMEDSEELVYEVGRHIAHDCKKAGIHWNFAPVADINLNPENPVIGYRSFGEDKLAVTRNALAYLNGMHSEGVLGAAKHFPGHGDTATDSHLGLPVIGKDLGSLESQELYPFRQMIDAGIEAIMAGHLSVPALTGGKNTPASVSGEIIQGTLREKLGFGGVVVSDALNMHSVSRMFPEKGLLEWEAFRAGNDVLCFSEQVKEGIARILENAPEQRIEESFKRIWGLKQKAMQNQGSPPARGFDHEALNQRLAAASLTMEVGSPGDLQDFRNAGFSVLGISSNTPQGFVTALEDRGDIGTMSWVSPAEASPASIRTDGEKWLVLLYPPSVKPTNTFGISAQILQQINTLMKTKEVVLYLFGNPYVLQYLEFQKARAVVIAYQDFPCFQENAFRHFLGEVKAQGKLPVTLKTRLP